MPRGALCPRSGDLGGLASGLGERNLTSENRPMAETLSGRLHLQGQRRSVAAFLAANKTLLAAVWVVGFTLVFLWQSTSISVGGGTGGGVGFLRLRSALPPARPAPQLRPKAYNLTDFGGVGDGRAVNTEAFERAVEAIAALADHGGGQLNVPPGRWLTAPFNLTSHMTLFLAEGAEILGIKDEKYWPLMPTLPSYGYGRERKGPRFGSLIHGQNLKDVVITAGARRRWRRQQGVLPRAGARKD